MKRVKLFTLLLVLVFASSAFAFRGQGGPMPAQGKIKMDRKQDFQPMDRLKAELKLSDAQVTKLENLKDAQRKSAQKIRLKIQKIRLNIKEEMLNDKINYDKILQYQKEINTLRNKLAEVRINNLKKVEKILSKKQFEKFKMHFLEMGQNMRKGKGNKGKDFMGRRSNRSMRRNFH